MIALTYLLLQPDNDRADTPAIYERDNNRADMLTICQRQAYVCDRKQLKGKPRVVKELVINFYMLLH